ncbi:MAG: hypothetical protein ABIP30_09985 [Ferruginibacter sp.]
MKKSKLTTGFNVLTDSLFQTTSESIYVSMQGNPNFPTTVPDMSVINTAVQLFNTTLNNAQTRDRNAVALKNEAREALTDLLIQLANSVMATANGNRAMLVSSGFDLAKDSETTPLTKPENIQLADGPNAGELVVKVDREKNAKSYIYQCTLDPLTDSSQWTQAISTSSKYTFKNLGTAQKYWCRVAAVGPYDQVVYSDTISRIAQ